MQSVISIYKVNQNDLLKVKNLIEVLETRMKDSLETLDEASIYIESIFLEQNHLYVYKLCKNINEMKSIQKNSKHHLYNQIRPVTEVSLELVKTIKIGLNLTRNKYS